MEQPGYYLKKAVRAEMEAAHAATPELAQSWLEAARLYRVMAGHPYRAERPKASAECSDPND